MSSKRPGEDIDRVAARVAENLEELIAVMQEAAHQISGGRSLQEVPVGRYHLYLAKTEHEDGRSRAEAIICTMEQEEYLDLLEEAAAEIGLCLEAESELDVALPEPEFGEDMVTGGFGNFKGVSVKLHNRCLDELIVAVYCRLEARGLEVACVPDEDVIFYLPLRD